MADILIKNGFVLTMRGEGAGVIEDGAVVIEGSRIVAVGRPMSWKRGSTAPTGSSTRGGRLFSQGSWTPISTPP